MVLLDTDEVERVNDDDHDHDNNNNKELEEEQLKELKEFIIDFKLSSSLNNEKVSVNEDDVDDDLDDLVVTNNRRRGRRRKYFNDLERQQEQNKNKNKNKSLIRIEDLAETDNNVLFSKLSTAFVTLFTEQRRMRELLLQKILPNILTALFLNDDNRTATTGKAKKKKEKKNETTIDHNNNDNNLSILETFTKKLVMLQDCLMFREHLKAIATNCFRQLEFQYSNESLKENRPLSHVNLTILFETICDCLSTACKIDEAIQSNGSLRRTFAAIKLAIKEALSEEVKEEEEFNEEIKKKLQALEKTIATLESQLLLKSCFEDITNAIVYGSYDYTSSSVRVTDDEFDDDKKTRIEEVPMKLLQALQTYGLENFDDNFVHKNQCGVLALAVLLVRLEPQSSDTRLVDKIFKHIFQHNVVGLAVSSAVVIDPLHFLLVQLPESALPSSKNKWQTHLENKLTQFNNMDVRIQNVLIESISEVTSWTNEFNDNSSINKKKKKKKNGDKDEEFFKTSLDLLVIGVYLARNIKAELELFIHLDKTFTEDLSKIPKQRARAYAQFAELLETIRESYYDSMFLCDDSLELSYIFAENLKPIQLIVKMAKEQLMNEINGGTIDKKIRSFVHEGVLYDALDACSLAERILLGGTLNFPKLGLLKLNLDIIKSINSKDRLLWGKSQEIIENLEIICDLNQEIKIACDCSCLFTVKEIFPIVLNDIYEHSEQFSRLPAVISAFQCPAKFLLADDLISKDYVSNFLNKAIWSKIITPIAHDIENDLRLSAVRLNSDNNNSNNEDIERANRVNRSNKFAPIFLSSFGVSIKERVKDVLAKKLYENAASSLENWKTYSEMRSIALAKYGIDLSEIDELPATIIGQKNGVLDIIQNISSFAVRYNYNMNTQTFIEKTSWAKDKTALNTLSIKNVAESIRTHGTGITHAVINSVYKYLAQRFQIFSQFLYEDHVKSLLLKEKQANAAEEVYEEYPIARAMQFLQEMRKLGVGDDGLSFLDQFRELITEIGNALGFVRMIRLGTMRYSSKANEFVTTTTTTTTTMTATSSSSSSDGFEKLARDAMFHDFTINASKQLDAEIESLRSNTTEGTDYFEVLTTIFAGELQSETNKHLSSFFLILPALMLSSVDSMYVSKQNLQKAFEGKKKNDERVEKEERREGSSASKLETQMMLNQSTFTDDGFSLGVAYILKVLDQDSKFDALNVFDSYESFYDTKTTNKETVVMSKKYERDEDREEHDLRLKRYGVYLREFKMLRYSYAGSRAFFHRYSDQSTILP